jgi:hypothetical protein
VVPLRARAVSQGDWAEESVALLDKLQKVAEVERAGDGSALDPR